LGPEEVRTGAEKISSDPTAAKELTAQQPVFTDVENGADFRLHFYLVTAGMFGDVMAKDTVRARRREDLNLVIDNGSRTSLVAVLIKQLTTGKLTESQRAIFMQAFDHYTDKVAEKEPELVAPAIKDPFA
jgi:hypothetical protein